MPAPFLLALGALGAGTVAQEFGQEYFDRRRGRQLGGILDDLPEGAGIDETRRAMATGGLLDPQTFAQIGFDDQSSRRDFLENLQAITAQADLQDRNAARAFGRSRGAAAEDRQFAGIEQINAVLGSFEQQAQTIGAEGGRIQRIVQLANQLPPSAIGRGIAGIDDPTTRAIYSRLAQEEVELFNEWLFSTYGDREPNENRIRAFEQAFPTFTNGNGMFSNATGRSFRTAMEVYGARYADVQQRLEALQGQLETDVRRAANPNQPITPRAPTLDFQVPSERPSVPVPGGEADDQTLPESPGGGVGSRSRRNR